MKGIALGVLGLMLLTGCAQGYEDQAAKLDRFAKKNKIGTSPDFYLVKNSGLAGPEPVALIFAMVDDYQFCFELAQLYMSRYPSDDYSCRPAN